MHYAMEDKRNAEKFLSRCNGQIPVSCPGHCHEREKGPIPRQIEIVRLQSKSSQVFRFHQSLFQYVSMLCCTGHILCFNIVGADHDLLSLHCETCGMLQQRQAKFRSLFCSVKKVTKGGHLVKPRRSISAFPLGAMSRMVGRGTRDYTLAPV